MSQGYLAIRDEYLQKAWARSPGELAASLPAELAGDRLNFPAFGEPCSLSAREITLSGKAAQGPEGLLIALYASFVANLPVCLKPLKSFKEFPGSLPYQAAFAAHAEQVLIPWVEKIRAAQEQIISGFSGHGNPDPPSGDFSFTLYPLPRVPLYYIFHLADEDFPASATCLFAANAAAFMPLDGLADVAEYTAKRVILLADGHQV
jgi:hypothetical protein